MLAAFLLVAWASAPAEHVAERRFPCQGKPLTVSEIAERRGLSPETVARLGTERSMTPEDVCDASAEVLARAIAKLEAPPDYPYQAIRHRLLDYEDENGRIPHDALMNAIQQVKLMRAETARRELNAGGIAPGLWTWLGPGNVGGRVRSVVIHPATPTTMWAGGVAGGVWKTTNGGTSWAPLDDLMANLAVTSIVLAPGDPNTLYAATGEGFSNADAIRGAGIFKSIDGGTSWARLANTNNPNFYFVNRLSFSPNGGVLLAATNNGIFRSTDAGVNWTQVHTSRTLDLDFHPTDNLKAIAGRGDGVVLYSNDGGVTWLTAASPGGGARVEVAYAPSNPSIAYASVNLNSGQIWRSTDGGQIYALAQSGSNYLGSQGWYDNLLWVDPTDPNVVVVGGIDLWRSMNMDAGTPTLTRISQWQSAPSSAHADHHFAVAHPGYNGTSNRTVFFGNDGGVYRAADVHTVALTSGWLELNNNLGITQFYGAAGNTTSGRIVGGTQDNGTKRYIGGTETWSNMFGGDGGFCAADRTDPNYFYGEYVYLQIHRSTNGGTSSSYIWNGITEAGSSSCANFIAPFILDPNNANVMLGGGCQLWKSANVKAATPTWASIKPGTQRISAITVGPGNSDLIWVGHNNGDVFKTVNGTAASPTWTQLDTGLPNRRVTRITVDNLDPNVVYATFAGYSGDNVWRTIDGGVNWSDRTGSGATGLPDAPVRSLVIHPARPAWIYAGTEVGIFASEDAGATWSLPQDGPANVSVDELFWMNDTLVAATHGRGLFSVPVSLAQLSSLTFSSGSSSVAEPAGPATVTVRIATSDGLATSSLVSVDYATGGGSAAAGSDYTTASGTLTFPSGTASGTTQTVNVTIANDPTAEPSETFNVTLSNATGGALGSPATHTVTILDDDTAPVLSVPNLSVTEGDTGLTNAVFSANLAQPLGRVVTVNYATAQGTARAGQDFQATNGTITFPVGTVSQSVLVQVIGDTVNERDETYSVNFTGGATASATGTILNDDTGPLATGFYPVTPCRMADTRNPPGPSGGPILSGGSLRSFPAGGVCGVPADAVAIAINVTAVGASAAGNFRIVPAGSPIPNASTLNFVPGRTRANNAIVTLGTGGQISVQCDMAGPGTVHFLFDVYGYFR